MSYNFSDLDPTEESDIKDLANETAYNSTCLSRKVGCIIVLDQEIVGVGWNAPPPEMQCDSICRKKNGGVCYAVHAEVAAIIDAACRGVDDLVKATLYTSNIIPCVDCQKLLYLFGVREVVCDKLEFYDGADLFWKNKLINFREYKL